MRASMSCLIVALGLVSGSALGTDLTTCLSGLEVSPGATVGDTTTGVTFAGTDSPRRAGECQWTTRSRGGAWYAIIDRQGPAGIGGEVTATGGNWLWGRANGAFYHGQVKGGTVTWPDSLENDLKGEEHLGCGPGVARFSVTLTVVGHQGGTFEGCLDDTHLNPFDPPFVFPPHISGLLTIHL